MDFATHLGSLGWGLSRHWSVPELAVDSTFEEIDQGLEVAIDQLHVGFGKDLANNVPAVEKLLSPWVARDRAMGFISAELVGDLQLSLAPFYLDFQKYSVHDVCD